MAPSGEAILMALISGSSSSERNIMADRKVKQIRKRTK
jgi:hypothetical protein